MSRLHHSSLTVETKKFYGKAKNILCENQADKSECKITCKMLSRKWPRLLDPAAVWKIFRKQQEAVNYVRVKSNGLMVFAFQDAFDCRMFLVAHPSVFWFYDSKRSSQDRCSYEIILEHAVCKLYFDLEFNKEDNNEHDGNKMIDSFIKIVSFHLKNEWGITVSRSDVLDLDSSTEKKFSRHLIFLLPNAVFQDNYSVGNFVKDICSQLRIYFCKKNGEIDSNIYKDINKLEIDELFVVDKKGNYRLFCDESVYSKNRHFRLYMSTKLNKNSPLIVSESNQYKPRNLDTNGLDQQLGLFLDSLITYVPINTDNLRVLKYESSNLQKECPSHHPRGLFSEGVISSSAVKSPYPKVDDYVTEIVSPGRIWRWLHFSSGSHLVYDIVGYRYCGNVGRQHRSNNIKYVVNLANYTYYQKCHDPDCSNYRSAECTLPPELVFLLEDDSFLASEDDTNFTTTIGQFGILEEDFVQLVDAVECFDNESEEASVEGIPSNSTHFPEYGISDCDLLSVVDVTDNT